MTVPDRAKADELDVGDLFFFTDWIEAGCSNIHRAYKARGCDDIAEGWWQLGRGLQAAFDILGTRVMPDASARQSD